MSEKMQAQINNLITQVNQLKVEIVKIREQEARNK